MTLEEKVGLIDNKENKLLLAEGIADNILSKNNIGDNQLLRTWLIERISADTLYDILMKGQKLYVLQLAKKCACDICFIVNGFDDKDFDVTMQSFGTIGAFVLNTIGEFHINVDDIVSEVEETASVIGYEDTLVIDDTMYIYNNEKSFYRVLFTFGYHKDYTCKNIEQRIYNRFNYRWDCEVRSCSVSKNDDNTFHGVAVIAHDCDNLDTISKEIAFRFGATSGKPWKRCKVNEVSKLSATE